MNGFSETEKLQEEIRQLQKQVEEVQSTAKTYSEIFILAEPFKVEIAKKLRQIAKINFPNID